MKKNWGEILLLAGIASAGILGSQNARADYLKDGDQVQTGCRNHDGHKHRHHGGEGQLGFAKIAERLGLSVEQKTKIKEIFDKNRKEAQPLRKELIAAKRELRGLTMEENTYEAAIRAQAAKLASIEGDMAIHRAGTAGQIRAILTPEQLNKFRSFHREQCPKLDERKEQP